MVREEASVLELRARMGEPRSRTAHIRLYGIGASHYTMNHMRSDHGKNEEGEETSVAICAAGNTVHCAPSATRDVPVSTVRKKC